MQKMSGTATHRLENTSCRTFFLRCPKKRDWIPFTVHIVCQPLLWRSWRHKDSKIPEWSRWPAIKATQPWKTTTNALHSSGKSNTKRLWATSLLAPFIVKLAKIAFWRKSSKTNRRCRLRLQVQPCLLQSQVSSASYVRHVEHSVMPSGQSFSAGQFHNCIFNIK